MKLIRKAGTICRVAVQTLSGDQRLDCPVCGHHGIIVNRRGRVHAECPKCGAFERHRHQRLVIDRIFDTEKTRHQAMLHVAPERFFVGLFRERFGTYETMDIDRPGVTHHADLRRLPFADGSYDAVYASHVLEHIDDDAAAIREIHRVLRPGGIAVLPVPIIGENTIEFGAPDPELFGHVRQPGWDYLNRYRAVFPKVVVYASADEAPRFACREEVPVCYR